jgi:hypothetical protein
VAAGGGGREFSDLLIPCPLNGAVRDGCDNGTIVTLPLGAKDTQLRRRKDQKALGVWGTRWSPGKAVAQKPGQGRAYNFERLMDWCGAVVALGRR